VTNNEDRFSDVAKALHASEIRELMKLAGRPGVISFAGGMPDAGYFPHAEILEIVRDFDAVRMAAAYQYGPTPGYGPLISQVEEYLAARGIPCSPDNIIITTGAQQGLHLAARIFINPGDTVVVENPSFVGGINAFLSCRARLLGVPLAGDGMDLDALEALLAREKGRVKFLYAIPNFQNPSGIAYSAGKRVGLLETVRRHGLILLEDDPYCELYFKGTSRDYASIKSIDNGKDVIYLGTFSKTLAPGFRIGYAVADRPIREKMELAKQSVDACSPMFSQVVAAEYLEKGYCARYVEKMRKVYGEKCACMVKALEAHLPAAVSFTRPAGGFFVWLTLPPGASAGKVAVRCVEQGVAVVTGAGFCVDDSSDHNIRLAFSNSSLGDIEKGAAILGSVLKKEVQ
jgi:2-aminoadipate transaminase